MKHIRFCALLLSAGMVMTSCEKELSSEVGEEETEVLGQSPEPSAHLNIITRGSGDDPDENEVSEGRIYIFNSSDQCVALLQTNDVTYQASADLAPDTYTLYAVGGPDLSRFVLPTKQQATPSSVITRVDGMVMDNLMLKTATVTITEGESVTQTIALDHKVLYVNQLDVHDVPDDVTKVEVTLSPLYKSIQLDGTYVTTDTESYKIALTQSSTTPTTWQASPHQALFPSKDTPTIKVTFTSPSGVKSYSYTLSEELPANHHFTISGTYSNTNNGIAFTGLLTSSDWGEDRTITFGFDESNYVIPVAGKKFNGYYVISVNSTARTALLLAKSSIEYNVPSANSSQATWLAALNTAMAGLTKPNNAQGEWRLPTGSEAQIFTQESSLFTTVVSPWYFCLINNTLHWCQGTNLDTDTPGFDSGTDYNNVVSLRPVIVVYY